MKLAASGWPLGSYANSSSSAPPERAHALWDDRGVAVLHGHALERQAEMRRANLGQRRLHPLPQRGRTGVDGHVARAVELDARVLALGRARLLDEERDAEAALEAVGRRLRAPAPQARVIECLESLVQQQRVVAAVVDDRMAVEQRARVMWELVDEVAPADLDLVDAETIRGDVDQPLAHEVDLVPSRRSIGPAGRLVGEDAAVLATIGGPRVRPGQHRDAEAGHSHAVRTHVRAGVVDERVLKSEEGAVGFQRQLDPMDLLARVVHRAQALLAILDPRHRPPDTHRRKGDEEVLRVELASSTEAAAY